MDNVNIALVLSGSKDVTEEIFWKRIVQPIFGLEPYSVTVDDAMLKKPISKILDKKIFIHIGDFTPSEDNIIKVNKLIYAILIDQYVLVGDKRVPVHAQLLITASQSLLTHINTYNSRFQYIYLPEEVEILKTLQQESIIDLILAFTDSEVDKFSTLLATFKKGQNKLTAAIPQEPKIQVQSIETLDEKIEAFVQAIKEANLDYFREVKNNDPEHYSELKFSFSKNCFIAQDLYTYFNLINKQVYFDKNARLLKLLKEKDEIFTQEIGILKVLDEKKIEQVIFNGNRTYKEVKNKKLYIIKDYTPPRNIKIQKDWIILNREGNQRWKYSYDDLDYAKKIYQEYEKQQVII